MGSQQVGGDARPSFTGIRRRLRGGPLGRLADLAAGLMMLSLSAIGILYVGRVPGLDPITIWPFALWAGLCAVLGVALSPLLRLRRTLLVVGYALILAVALGEETRFVLRPLWRDPAREIGAAAEHGDLLRVITLNCGGGREEAVLDALAYEPDILLLQETPGSSLLERILPEGWEHAGTLDPAVAVRGALLMTPHPKWLAHEVCAVSVVPARLAKPTPIAVISTRLLQPLLRADLWRPSVWRSAQGLRASRMNTIESVLRQRDRYGEGLPVIVGGDFNTRPGDSLLLPLEAGGLADAFEEAGAGWPNTITSDYPMERIDFIWVDERFEPLNAFVAVTPHSDHRMVVVDVALR